MSSQPHDALFKAVFSQAEHAAGLLSTVLPAALCARLDWSTLARSAGAFIDPQLAERRSDLLFSVRTRQGSMVLLYVLIEHQSEPDPWMALRLHGYVHRIWEHWRREHGAAERLPAVLPVVVHHGASGWTAARSLGELYDLDADAREVLDPLLPELRFVLDDLGRIAMERVEQRPMTDLGRLALLFLQRVRISPDLAADVRRWLGMLGRVFSAPSGGEAVGLLLSYILSVLETVPDGVLAALDAGLGREAREVYMSAAQKLIDQGRDQGRVEGKAEMLLQLVQLRFGSPPPTIVARVRAASDSELAQWAERILTAPTLADLFASE